MPARDPFVHCDAGKVAPGKRPGRIDLIAPIHQQGIMRASSAQASAFTAISYVFEGSGIEQERLSLSDQAHAERVGVTVASATRTQRAGIDLQLLSRILVKQVNATITQGARNACRFR